MVSENVTFVIVCIAVVVGIFIVTVLLEKLLCHDIKKFSSTHFISYTAMFACLAGILMTVEIPLFFAPDFYKMDLSEMPVLICTFYLGPVAGVSAELLKVLLKLLIRGTSTLFVGDFANFVTGCSFILPASLIYHARPGKTSALVGMGTGTLCLTAFGSYLNAVYLLPKFAQIYGCPIDAFVSMGNAVNSAINSVSTLVLFAVVPFNLVKGIVVSALTFLLYKRISPMLHRHDQRRNKT